MKSTRSFTIMMLCGSLLFVIGCANPASLKCKPMPEIKQRFLLLSQSNQRAIDDHIYFSREGASGGRTFGGGGCGCN